MSLLELFCNVDDFCLEFEPKWQAHLLNNGVKRRNRQVGLCLSEIMTILIHFHESRYRDFKSYYTRYVQKHLSREFPGLVSYHRFVELMPRSLVALAVYLRRSFGNCTGISFVDSTALAVCRNQRIKRHKVFAGLAARGKTSMGWFFGFKLHLAVNDQGELLGCYLTAGNVDDRKPVPHLARHLFGKLIGDKGYISQELTAHLMDTLGVHLLTFLRSNMNGRLVSQNDLVLLRKRAIIETINDQLKNISQIEHSRHRSPINFIINLFAGLIAYCRQPKKPALRLDDQPLLTTA
jgi:hypothetical protein